MTEATFSPFGVDLFGQPVAPPNRGPLATRFEWPPFSVLDARGGEWHERKSAWMSMGIQGEIGRQAKAYNTASWLEANGNPAANKGGGTSIFDPVLTELLLRWFCHDGGQVVDPFAGGSVRGIVAALLGRSYWGCDLRQEQIDANRAQRDAICPEVGERLTWVCGDALDVLAEAPPADLILTCPPYGDLERYSDDPRDLSTMDYHAFLAALRRVALRCAALMKPGAYAALVVGDFRDKRTGHYRGFVADTVVAFRDVGLPLYNDAILVTMVGSLPIRVSSQFEASRKLGKTHQNVLVFVKPKKEKGAPPA